mgnify:CR=1 FL=1
MYINNEDFEKWMDKLSKKLSEIGQDLKSLINISEVFNEDEKLLDNQDLAFLLTRELQDNVLKKVSEKFNEHADIINNHAKQINSLSQTPE